MEFASNTRTCPNFSATQLKILPLLQGHHVHLLPAKDLPLLVLFHNSKPFLKQPDRHTHSPSASSSPPSLLQNSIKVTSQQRDKLLSQSGEVYIGLGRLGIFLFDSICGPLGHGNWPWFFTSQVSTISVFFGIRWNRPKPPILPTLPIPAQTWGHLKTVEKKYQRTCISWSLAQNRQVSSFKIS